MPPVGVAIGAAASAIGASVSAALTGAVFSGFALRAFTQIAVGVAFSAVGRMLAPKARLARQGVRTSVGFGEDAPATLVLGRYATAGDLVYAGSHGPDNNTYVLVLELGDVSARLRRVMVNGEWVTLSATDRPWGRGVVEYRNGRGDETLSIKLYDGLQTTACSYLLDAFGDDPDRPWQADMIGRGIPYAVVSVQYDPKIHRGVPELMFELDGMRLYDPRRDSSIGGAGPQRWSNPASWSGFGDPANDNPVVQIYNLMLGLRDPVTGARLWGGSDIGQRDLPVSSWFAAMNECDVPMPAGESGLEEPQYRSGIEIALEDETEPADVIEVLLQACQGQIAEAAGSWVIRAGPPGAAVFAFSDDDVIVTSPEELDPFPGLDQVWNGVSGRYPEPEDGWADVEAPLRLNASYRDADGGRSHVAPLAFPTVPYRAQVQRLMASALKDGRRFRRHTVVLPPEARALGPLDVVEWTSERHGYENKQFSVDLLEDLANGCVALALREIDPSDYDFAAGDLLPTTVSFLGRPPRLPRPLDFGAEGVSLPDAAGTARRPGIKLDWNPDARANGVRYQLQLLDRPDEVPLLGGHDTSDDDYTAAYLEVFAGEPLEVRADEPLVAAFLSEILAGTTVITAGVLPGASYRIRARYVPNGGWCDWIEVTTPDTRVTALDLDAALNTRIDDAQSKADAAASDAAVAVATANEARGIAEALAGDTIADLEALLAAFEGVDASDIVDNRLLTLRALQSGWNADPTFQLWMAGVPERWTATGLSGNGGPFAGFYGGGLALDIPAGAIAVTLTAASAVAGQMPAADPDAPWLVLYALVTFTTGNPAALTMRAEWLADGASTWTRGEMRGVTAAEGSFSQLELGAKPGVMQGVEVLVKRPPGLGANADGVRLVLAKTSAITTAVDCDVHLFGLRKASEAEIAAGQAAGELSAAVTSLTTTITGVSGALAALTTSLATTAPGGVTALLASTYLTSAATTAAISAMQTTLQTNINGVSANLATNYFLKSQVTAAIATAVGGVSTTLGARIDATEAAISDEAGFRVSADAALAGRITTVEARRDPGAVVANGSFTAGLLPPWSTLPATWSIVAKGGTASAQQGCPTPHMLRMGVDAVAARTLTNERFEAREGDYVSASFLYATAGTTRDATLRLWVRFLDAAGAQIGSPLNVGPNNASSTAWLRYAHPSIGPAPAGTAFVRVDLHRGVGGAGDAFVTGVDARKGDPVALARLSTVESVAANASSAITSLRTTIEAAFGTSTAFVSEMQGAVATLDSATAFWGFRQKAGAAVGTAEAVAFAHADGTALATFSLDYDVINLEGRVSARDLVISDSSNLVPDDQLQSAAIWDEGAEWQVFPTHGIANAHSLGEVRYIGTAATGAAVSTGLPFAVKAGETLACSFRFRIPNGQARAYAQLLYYDADGVALTTVSFGVTLTTSTSTVAPAAAVVTVPDAAFKAAWRWVVDRTQTTASYVRFFAPVCRRQTSTIELADGAVTAEKANFADLGAVVATLGTCTITSALNFAPGVVVTGAIGMNAVTDIGVGLRESLLTVAADDTWYDVCAFTVSVAAGAAVILSSRVELERSALWNTTYGSYKAPGLHRYRLLRGSTVILNGLREIFVDGSPPTGTVTYKLQIQTADPDASGSYERHALDSDGDYTTIDVSWTSTSKNRTARVGYGHLIVQSFKR